VEVTVVPVWISNSAPIDSLARSFFLHRASWLQAVLLYIKPDVELSAILQWLACADFSQLSWLLFRLANSLFDFKFAVDTFRPIMDSHHMPLYYGNDSRSIGGMVADL
jgi:hypothetical protein